MTTIEQHVHEAAAAPVQFTATAQAKVHEFLNARGKAHAALRIGVAGRTATGFRYAMNIIEPDDRDPSDITIDGGGFPVFIDGDSMRHLAGTMVDFVTSAQGAGFQLNNPNPVWADELAMTVQRVLDTQVNPGVGSHGGHVELIDVREHVAYVRFEGGCQGCGLADVTLKQGIEALILEAVPAIVAVRDATDHAMGENPYYKPEE